MKTPPKHLIRTLLHRKLGRHERNDLMENPAVLSLLNRQWDQAPNAAKADGVDGSELYKRIDARLTGRKCGNTGRLWGPLYGVAVSVLLLLSVFHQFRMGYEQTRPVVGYVVTTGVQRVEEVTLPDGSTVKLGPRSRLEYPNRFTGNRREVTLTGQAFITVAKDPLKPFTVMGEQMNVTALGTAFEVFNYPHHDEVETILLNGRVQIELKDSLSRQVKTFELQPDQKFSYSRSLHRGELSTLDANRYTAWRHKHNPSFENEQLGVIVPRLEEWYGIRIVCPEAIAHTYRYTFTIRDESLERILTILSHTSPVGFTKTDQHYTLHKKTKNRHFH